MGFLVWLGSADWAAAGSAQSYAGLVVDDDKAAYTGDWVNRAKQTPLVGASYHHDYNARLDEPLRAATAQVWTDGFAKLCAGQLDPNALARAVATAERTESAPTGKPTRGATLRQMWKELDAKPSAR